MEKARGGHHPHHPTQLGLWDTGQFSDILDRYTVAERYTRQHLELPEPMQTGEVLVLAADLRQSQSVTGK